MTVGKQLEALPSMSKTELVQLWQNLFGNAAGLQLRRNLLVRVLAYRIQEKAYGGLSKATQERLLNLARKLKTHPKVEIRCTPAIKPGTRLQRQWQGKTHHVTVIEHGYEYAGNRYRSLSQIARLITGTRWNGPLFFGLRPIGSERVDAEQR